MNRGLRTISTVHRIAALGVLATALVVPALAAVSEPTPTSAPRLVHTAATEPVCLTPVAPDGFEPPCNPYLGSVAWGGAHRGSYAQASSPYPAPAAGDEITVQHVAPLFGVPLFVLFTEPYADGGRAAWMATVASPDGRYIYKVDAATGEQIDRYGAEDEVTPPGTGGVSGAYSVLDRDNHLIVGRERSFDVYGDSVPGNRLSPITKLRHFELPDSALCGPDDNLVGITMLFDGRIAFASALGVVGTVPREPARMYAKNLVTYSTNGARCATASADDSSLDQVSNSIAADEHGGIYMVTSKAQYRFAWDGRRITRTWRAGYETGAASAVRIGEGSGSTPTLMGSGPGQDRFVVITDGQKLMHLNLFWRDRIPADWKGLPGRSRRLACEIPVDFGDPDATESQSEQSVLVRRYGAVVVNNQLKNDDALAGLSGNARLLAAALAGGDPNNAPYGIQRFDWDPRSRTCSATWVNQAVSIPNGIPGMSTSSGLVYGIGQRDGVWGLEGLSFRTGTSVLRVDTTPAPDQNSAYAATTVGPDDSIWSGTLGGYTIFRGPPKPLPATTCVDITAPESSVRTTSPPRPRTSLTRSRLTVAGPVRDRACGVRTDGHVRRVQVSVQLRRPDGCRSVRADGTLRVLRRCSSRLWVPAHLGADRRSFVLRREAHLRPGRYVVVSRATDARGNQERHLERVRLRVR